MENLKYKDKVVELSYVTGEVLGSDKFSETHVSSSGGGHIGGGMGTSGSTYVPSTVSSTVSTNHEFWVKTDDGHEKDFQFRGVDIPLRAGQKITIVDACLNNNAYYTMLINHSAGKHWWITEPNQLNEKLGMQRAISGMSFLYSAVIVAAGFGAAELLKFSDSSRTSLILWTVIPFIIFRMFWKNEIHKSAQRILREHLLEQAEWALRNL